ncbi:MAG: SDR family oxidoreductase [Verrucomicrobia bacterium]|jgi:nucleoside-diphosphate-sugar epimerase|nr:SDR family oxidoreductase [Verrucomicrobiota bacterium]
MRVLIVGCGYVGLPLGRVLAQTGHTVFGLRRNRSSEAELRQAGLEPVWADLTEPGSLERLPGPFDWVVNCTAAGGGGAEEYRRIYLDGTRHLVSRLGASPDSGTGAARYVYTSSTSVYGQNDGSWVTEASATEPAAETGRILLEVERFLLETHRASGFPAIILRLAGIYGPGRGYWLKQFLSGQARLEGDGRRFLNMIHRDDVVGALVAALERGAVGEVYNVVDDEPVAQKDLLGWLAGRLGRPLPEAVPPDPLARKRGVTDKRISNRKLRDELGCRLKFPTFREGFQTLLEP